MHYMKCLGIGSIEEVMSRQSPEEASSPGGRAEARFRERRRLQAQLRTVWRQCDVSTSAGAAAHRVTSVWRQHVCRRSCAPCDVSTSAWRGGEQGRAREEVLQVWVLSCVLILFSWENSTTLPISLTEFSNMVMDLFHKNSYCGVFPCYRYK